MVKPGEGPVTASVGNGVPAADLAYDKRTMESIRKRVKVITWLLVGALVLGTGAGVLSGVI